MSRGDYLRLRDELIDMIERERALIVKLEARVAELEKLAGMTMVGGEKKAKAA